MLRRKHGFTLIELLVVIAIIAILAAILFPVFIRAKRVAQQNKCLGNLKQIGTALKLYLDDFNDRYPLAPAYWGLDRAPKLGECDATSPSVAGLIRLLYPYSKNLEMWICPSGAQRPYRASSCTIPSGATPALVGWIKLDNGTLAWTNYISYPLNRATPAEPEYARGWTPLEAMTKWGRVFSEGGVMHDAYPNPVWNNRLIQDAYTVGTYGESGKWRPHRNGTNILYHDGHVAWARDFRPGDDF